MKKHLLIVFISLTISSLSTTGQENNDPVLITIDSLEVTKSEFERIYKKSNGSRGVRL